MEEKTNNQKSPQIQRWDMNDQPSSVVDSEKIPQSTPETKQDISLYNSFKGTLFAFSATVLSAFVVFLLANLDSFNNLGFVLAWATMGTFLLVPFIAGITTIIVFILEFRKLSKG